jgi:hypothetical protein
MKLSQKLTNKVILIVLSLVTAFIIGQPNRNPNSAAMPGSNPFLFEKSLQNPVQRLIVKNPDFSPPVRIISAKVRKGAIKFGEKFIEDDDDWFRNLAIEVINESGRSVNFVEIGILFREATSDHKPPASWSIEFGDNPFKPNISPSSSARVTPIEPGKLQKIELSDADFGQLKYFLTIADFPASLHHIEVRVTAIGFVDGTAWQFGHMLRRDPKHPSGWSPPPPKVEEAPINAPGGSAQNRTAFFLKSKGFGNEAGWRFLNAAWNEPSIPTPVCGLAYSVQSSCNPQPPGCQYTLVQLDTGAYGNDILEPTTAPCRITINGTTVTCTFKLSVQAAACVAC